LCICHVVPFPYSFFFIATAPTETSTLSLHDALPIFHAEPLGSGPRPGWVLGRQRRRGGRRTGAVGHRHRHRWLDPAARRAVRHRDRKSTRLNSSHRTISYAVFCLKKKKKKQHQKQRQ